MHLSFKLTFKFQLFLLHPLCLSVLQWLYRPADSCKTASEENDWLEHPCDAKLYDFHCNLHVSLLKYESDRKLILRQDWQRLNATCGRISSHQKTWCTFMVYLGVAFCLNPALFEERFVQGWADPFRIHRYPPYRCSHGLAGQFPASQSPNPWMLLTELLHFSYCFPNELLRGEVYRPSMLMSGDRADGKR